MSTIVAAIEFASVEFARMFLLRYEVEASWMS